MIFCLVVFIINNNKSKCDKTQIIKTLVRQAARWSTAAAQDSNPLISILHANYGAGYLWALRDIATDAEIESAVGIDILQFRDAITNAQDYSAKKMMAVCPQFAPKDAYLSKIAKEM